MVSYKSIKLFLSAPSDVAHEIEILKNAIDVKNIWLRKMFGVEIEVFHYQSNVHADVGKNAQLVIDRQSPKDPSIFLAILWKRIGTPVEGSPSGTVHEFRRHYDQRATGKNAPVIIVMFKKARLDSPSREELQQYSKLLEFRSEVESKALISKDFDTELEFLMRIEQDIMLSLPEILGDEKFRVVDELREEMAKVYLQLAGEFNSSAGFILADFSNNLKRLTAQMASAKWSEDDISQALRDFKGWMDEGAEKIRVTFAQCGNKIRNAMESFNKAILLGFLELLAREELLEILNAHKGLISYFEDHNDGFKAVRDGFIEMNKQLPMLHGIIESSNFAIAEVNFFVSIIKEVNGMIEHRLSSI
ncbi:MAG: hypothetical protein QM743_12335 [Chitinophagaceae bacterium]